MARVVGGGMAAVTGMQPDKIKQVLKDASFESIDIANYNSPKQTVISGQKEDIDAIEQGIDPKTYGIPNIRDGSQEVLDVRFISFGNVAVELLHIRDARLKPNAPNWNVEHPSCRMIEKTCVAYANVPHLSFHVKDDIDFNQFAKDLEEECQKREINFLGNRIIRVKSEEERRRVALKYTVNRFWNDPEYFVEGYSDADFGDFLGWSLFYAKGPNGEQLEFNQVTRRVRELFMKAQAEYNEAYWTDFKWPSGPTNTKL